MVVCEIPVLARWIRKRQRWFNFCWNFGLDVELLPDKVEKYLPVVLIGFCRGGLDRCGQGAIQLMLKFSGIR